MEKLDIEKTNIEQIDNNIENENIQNIKKTNNYNFNIIGILLLVTVFTGWIWFLWIILFYILKKEDMNSNEIEFIKNAINFNLSFTIYIIISLILTFVVIWFLWIIIFGLAYFIFSIIWVIKAFNQEVYKFPWTINFIK